MPTNAIQLHKGATSRCWQRMKILLRLLWKSQRRSGNMLWINFHRRQRSDGAYLLVHFSFIFCAFTSQMDGTFLSSPIIQWCVYAQDIVFSFSSLDRYIVTYALGIYLLNQLIGFLSPQFDPEENGDIMGSNGDFDLPTSEKEEYRPFARRLPEFKFWYACTRGTVMAFFMTFFSVFDVPVFWPILLLYFIVLFFITMKRQIRHMIKHRYVPWSWGKTKYAGKSAKPSE